MVHTKTNKIIIQHFCSENVENNSFLGATNYVKISSKSKQ